MLLVGVIVALVGSLFYNWKQYTRLRAYEQVWEQIEQIADKNEDGSFTIHIQHVEEHHAGDTLEAHMNVAPGVSILDGNEPSLEMDDTPPKRAA